MADLDEKLRHLERMLVEVKRACDRGNAPHGSYLIQFAQRDLADIKTLLAGRK